MKLKERAQKLVEEHWEYVEKLIINEYLPMETHGYSGPEINAYLERVGFHYRSAMIHGYKHGFQDAIRIMQMKAIKKSKMKP